ncbi:acyltransferase [Neobacillus drentensis]|uniref:acyltransferase n=1 Tax=Neobacillus drentensis TaxID=220684 RepID=UPI002FFFD7A7
MRIKKLLWGLRSLIYKLTFKKFGNWSYIGTPIVLDGVRNVEIGNRVRIQPGLRLETIGNEGSIIIEENTSIGQNFHITSKGKLTIGKNTTILGNVFITNIDHDYQEIDKHILEQKYIVNDTVIGENCFIGYGAAIQAGTKLGKQCIVGTNSVVRGEFPDYSVIVGAPARIVKQYNHSTKVWERV